MALRFGFGLVIDTDLEIPGTVAVDPAVPCDGKITIIWSRSERMLNESALYTVTKDGLVFAAPMVGQYHISLDHIAVTLDPRADISHAIDLLIATALPALMWLRGHLLLHAAAVILPGQLGAIAIAGRSGVGKSSAAKALVEIGAKVVGDDSLAISIQHGHPMAWGLAGGLFVGRGAERRFESKDYSMHHAKVAAVIILEQASEKEGFARLRGVNALEAIANHFHRRKVPTLLGLSGHAITTAVKVAQSVPIIAWSSGHQNSIFDTAKIEQMVEATKTGELK